MSDTYIKDSLSINKDRKVAEFNYEQLPGRVIFKTGGVKQTLVAEVHRLGLKRILIITGSSKRKLAEDIENLLAECEVYLYAEVHQHVPIEYVIAGRKIVSKNKIDGLVSIGGGSATGLAKAIVLESAAPIICIPTTYAGSEMTPVWGITKDRTKQVGRSNNVLPTSVIYDAKLTYSLPKEIFGPSGINGIAHCVESFFSLKKNPMSLLMGIEGIKALSNGLKLSINNPDKPLGRELSLYGAYLAGATFAITGSGLHHKICHALGGSFNLPHAETHTIVLPHVLALRRSFQLDIVNKLMRALKVNDLPGYLFDLGRLVDAPKSLKDIGLKDNDLNDALNLIKSIIKSSELNGIKDKCVYEMLVNAFEGNKPIQS